MSDANPVLAGDQATAHLGYAVFGVADAAKHAAELEDLARILVDVRQAKRDLSDIERDLERSIGERMPTKRVTVENLGTLERHPRKSYTKWDREALLRDVLDSRLVDTETGELVDETPLDKVLKVWNLPAPRRTVLVERGLQPDEYAHVEDNGGFTVQVLS